MCVVYISWLASSNNSYGSHATVPWVSVSMAGLSPATFCILRHNNFWIYSFSLAMKQNCQSACYQLCSWHFYVRYCHKTNIHAIWYQSKQAPSSLYKVSFLLFSFPYVICHECQFFFNFLFHQNNGVNTDGADLRQLAMQAHFSVKFFSTSLMVSIFCEASGINT
jgi:hypothetical protein